LCKRSVHFGDLKVKKAILTAIGKKITLLGGKIHIEPEEWLVPIADKYPALEKQYEYSIRQKMPHTAVSLQIFSLFVRQSSPQRKIEPELQAQIRLFLYQMSF